MSLFVCEISGESSSTGMVATPSGHVCRRSLLLQKLSENGGVDPFERPPRPLAEDDLIDLLPPSSSSGGEVIPPRAASATSLSSLLELVQKEYDAVLLELFDTRRALDETRQELSQALYQNDAATRVVARLAMERDAARQQLEQLSSSGAVGAANGAPARSPQLAADGDATSAASVPESAADDEPPSKKAKLEEGVGELQLPLRNEIPEADLRRMVAAWEELNKGRKQALKDRAAIAPSPEDMAASGGAPTSTASYHKTKCKGIVAIAASDNLLATAGADKSVIVYDAEKQTVVQSISSGRQAVTALDVSSSLVLVGRKGGTVTVYSIEDGAALGSVDPPESVAGSAGEKAGAASLASAHLHPDGAHGLIAYQSGHLALFSLETYAVISIFEGGDGAGSGAAGYTCGALHPDGLIYLCGTSEGNLVLWDLKNRTLAATLSGDEGQGPLTAVAVSENGYHIAAAHGSSSSVALWDLRKQKQTGAVAGPCDALAFDDSGKYLAVGGAGSLRIFTAKDKTQAAALQVEADVAGLRWVLNKLSVVSGKGRDVSFYG
jgi:pre-mRNA-processing factor 19